MNTSLVNLLLVLAIAAPMALGFTSPAVISGSSNTGTNTALSMTKKFPAGRPLTVQADEDMAMWFEDETGNRKKALDKPVEGRPVIIYTKDQVEEIEKKGVPLFVMDQAKAFAEWFTARPLDILRGNFKESYYK